jgi:hypothetical protein
MEIPSLINTRVAAVGRLLERAIRSRLVPGCPNGSS